MTGFTQSVEVDCIGPDGADPLGFLAAIGLLRAASLTWPEQTPRLAWHAIDAGWRPSLHLESPLGEKTLAEGLQEASQELANHAALAFADDLTLEPGPFRDYAESAARAGRCNDRTWPDYAAAFGSSATVQRDGRIQDTAFRTMRGAGHQHFLETMRTILGSTTAEHFRKTLFETWRFDDPLEKSSMRWSPMDDQRYALRPRNPSGDPERRRRGSVLGANALAIFGLTLFPTAVIGRRLHTAGWNHSDRSIAEWTWPIWSPPATCDVTRSLLTLRDLQDPTPDRVNLRARGIVDVFRARRTTIGKFRSFTPARSV